MKGAGNQPIHSRRVMRKMESWGPDESMECRYAGPHPRMTHEHRPFRRSLGSNAINRGKIAAAMLMHFLH